MNKFAALMNQFGVEDTEEVKAATEVAMYNAEQLAYEAQAVYNFFVSRIQPELQKKQGESETAFTARQDKAYSEWRFKECRGCHERFAYAYSYDGVSHCSLECLEKSLAEIGIKFSRHKDLRRRWGAHHPAIVPASALQVLSDVYAESSPRAFAS